MFKYLYWNKEQQLPKKLTIDSFREREQDNKLYQKLNAKFHFIVIIMIFLHYHCFLYSQ